MQTYLIIRMGHYQTTGCISQISLAAMWGFFFNQLNMVRANEQLINNIICSSGFVPINEAFHGWVIVIDGKVYKPRVGNFIYKTRQQAVKSFYNGMRGKVARHYAYLRDRGVSIPNPPWTGNYWNQRGEYWKNFKEYLGNRLKIVQI